MLECVGSNAKSAVSEEEGRVSMCDWGVQVFVPQGDEAGEERLGRRIAILERGKSVLQEELDLQR